MNEIFLDCTEIILGRIQTLRHVYYKIYIEYIHIFIYLEQYSIVGSYMSIERGIIRGKYDDMLNPVVELLQFGGIDIYISTIYNIILVESFILKEVK